jgi:phosphopantothenoylcysteine synthetase/decarboxylase
MHRRLFITGLTASLLIAPPAFAQRASVVDQVITQLKSQGYTRITVGRTLLGRTRIVARNDEMRREIIINPSTGEVLRDYWEVNADDDRRDDNDRSSSGSSRRESDDDRDDDDDDDDDDRDDDRDDDDDDDDGGDDDDDDDD